MKLKNFVKFGLAVGAAAAAAPYIQKKLKEPAGKRFLYDTANGAANGLCSVIGAVLPDGETGDVLDFTPDLLLPGTGPFLKKAAANARWHLGFAKESLLPDDISADKYYIGGYLAFPPNVAEGVLDDQMIRCVALSDGSGRGIAVFAVIDCVGISNHDINEIRTRLLDDCREKNIVSINISATHSHSCIDTMGVWGELTTALKVNPGKVRREETDFVSGRNELFMENLKQAACRVIRTAVENMKPGQLQHGIQDGSRFVRDKRPPEVMMTEINTLLFTPDDGSAPTRAIIMAAHPTQFGGSNKIISADYPYYICEEWEKRGENALFFQGAQLAIATERAGNVPDGLSRAESIQEYGRAIGRFCLEAEMQPVEPLLNITGKRILVTISNKIFDLLAKIQVIDNDVLTGGEGGKLLIVSELGYAELGDIKIAMLPGEVAPELIRGGCLTAEESYDGSSWCYAPLEETAGSRLVVIGLCNDEIGYIIPDNDFGSIVAPLHYEESVSTGKHTASKIVKEFTSLLKSIQYQAD